MKTFKIFLFIFIALLALAGCNKTSNTAEKESVNNAQNNGRVDPHPETVPETQTSNKDASGNSEAKIVLNTIQCSTCKKTITKALKTDPAIKDINVNVEGKFVTVNYDKSKTSVDKIESIITSAGYDANEKKADPKAYDKLESCCKIPDKK